MYTKSAKRDSTTLISMFRRYSFFSVILQHSCDWLAKNFIQNFILFIFYNLSLPLPFSLCFWFGKINFCQLRGMLGNMLIFWKSELGYAYKKKSAIKNEIQKDSIHLSCCISIIASFLGQMQSKRYFDYNIKSSQKHCSRLHVLQDFFRNKLS